MRADCTSQLKTVTVQMNSEVDQNIWNTSSYVNKKDLLLVLGSRMTSGRRISMSSAPIHAQELSSMTATCGQRKMGVCSADKNVWDSMGCHTELRGNCCASARLAASLRKADSWDVQIYLHSHLQLAVWADT